MADRSVTPDKPARGPAGSPAPLSTPRPASHAEPAGLPAVPNDARASLAAQQRDLVGALTSGADVPGAFDADRVRLAARTLAHKRRHGVEKTWPGLIAALGDRWSDTFATYASAHPIPTGGSPLEDGLAFARNLRRSGTLPPEALPILLAAEVRRGGPIRIGLTSAPRRLVLAVRVGRGTRVLVLPLDFSRPFRPPPR